jgi:ankyrin repeat protein
MSTLYDFASTGSVERALNLLSKKSTDIDERCDGHGWTPLMVASKKGYLRIVRVLLRHGACVSASTDYGHTALHISMHNCRLAVTKTLIKAGADLEAKATCFTGTAKIAGHTPLHLAAGMGFCDGMVALISAGANINSRMSNGATPLYLSACCGEIEALRILLRAGADPLLPVDTNVPLDVASQEGHLPVVRELVQNFGIKGCSFAGGIEALETAAFQGYTHIISFLCDSGVLDDEGTAFCAAVEGRHIECAKLLLQRRGGMTDMDGPAYINIAEGHDSPLLCTFYNGCCLAPRMARFLIDQGASTTTKVSFHLNSLGTIQDTPLVAAKMALQHAENTAGLRGVVRLLQQVDAIHAVSWLWPSKTVVENKREKKLESVGRMLPILRERAKKPRVLLGALDRYNKKQDGAFMGYEKE